MVTCEQNELLVMVAHQQVGATNELPTVGYLMNQTDVTREQAEDFLEEYRDLAVIEVDEGVYEINPDYKLYEFIEDES